MGDDLYIRSFNEHGNDLHFGHGIGYSYDLQNFQGEVGYGHDLDALTISYYTLNSVVSQLWQSKVHVILRSFVVLTWLRDTIELV